MSFLKLKNIFFLPAISLFLVVYAGAQETTSPEDRWVRIVSPKSDFTVDMPRSDWIVDNEGSRHRIFRYTRESSVSVSMRTDSGAKSEFRTQMRYMKDKDRYEFFEAGDFLVMQYKGGGEEEGEKTERKGHYMWLQIFSSKGEYSVSVSTENAKDDFFGKVLGSIRLGQKHLFKEHQNGSPVPEEISIDSLKSDDQVVSALRRPDSKQSNLTVAMADNSQPADKPTYSRRLILLQRVKATYTNSARSNGVTGTVRLRITFLASGELGPIELMKSLDKGLDKAAFEAAKKFKFLPAQIDGKPVDVTRPVVYTFNIY